MDFFQAQDNARKNTGRLVFFLILAVLSLIVVTNILVMFSFGFLRSEGELGAETVLQQLDWTTFLTVGAGVSLVILLGSLYKMSILSGGGRVVAESLGGQLIPPNAEDLTLRKVLNVVEEMAIASGTPVPPVYLLAEEQGINAFAAGFTPSDAVIGVTRGTVELLSREQLQGVIAHEFSHILNGDMRLNIRLMGILHGILLIGIIGYFILHSSGRRSSRSSGGAVGLGLGLMIVGFAGTFFGNIIKASVSRQREYLADASALQFTRNPFGIAGALKRIGGYQAGSIIENPSAPEVSHSFFSQGVGSFLSLFATHPPLANRIKRIDPHWDGNFPAIEARAGVEEEKEDIKAEKTTPRERAETFTKIIVAGATVAEAVRNINQMGQPNERELRYAQALIQQIPTALLEAAHEPYGARAVIYALVTDKESDIRDLQMSHLQQYGDKGIYELTAKLLPEIDQLADNCRLPLIDLSLPALREMSLGQFQLFRRNLDKLVEMDSKIDLFEWALHKILVHHLDAAFIKPKSSSPKYSKLAKLKKECELLFSLLAYSGHSEINEAKKAFAEAQEHADLKDIEIVPKSQIKLETLDVAVDQLTLLKPLSKGKLLRACLACVTADQKIVPKEMELVRAVSDALDCPMPPLIYGE